MPVSRKVVRESGDASYAIACQLMDKLEQALTDLKATGLADDVVDAAAQTVCVLLSSAYLVRQAIVHARPLDYLEGSVPAFAEAVATVAVDKCSNFIAAMTRPPAVGLN